MLNIPECPQKELLLLVYFGGSEYAACFLGLRHSVIGSLILHYFLGICALAYEVIDFAIQSQIFGYQYNTANINENCTMGNKNFCTDFLFIKSCEGHVFILEFSA